MPFAQQLLPEWDHEIASTRKILAVVPEEHLTWKPHEKSMTLGRLAGHVAEFPSWAVNSLTKDSLDVTPAPGQQLQAGVMKTREATLAQFDTDVAAARAALESATDEHMSHVWSLTLHGRTLISQPRSGIVRTMVINHMIHHRGQLGVYLRLLNVPIPGMYGPTADEK